MKHSHKPVTMQQIADELGLSRVTVSSVLNGKAEERNISRETIERVNEYISRRGFVPSQQARNLKTGSRNAVGILHCGNLYSHLIEAFNYFTNHFSGQPSGMELVITKRENIVEGIRDLISRGVSRLIWIHTRDAETELGQHREILPLLNNVECVIYNYVFDGGYRDAELEKNGIFMVGPDEDKINEELGFFLKNLGHRNIAVSEYYESLEACGSSFLAGLEKTGLNTVKLDQPELMAFGIDELASYFADTIISLMKSAEITAAAFLDDEIAAAVMMELIRGGIKIPEQLTITGFDNLKFTNFLAVPLTTVKMPVREMVKQTIRIFEEDTEAYRFPFPLEIIKRKSHREVFSEG